MAVALALTARSGLAVHPDVPDRLSGLRVEGDLAVLLPAVEQPVVLVLARNARLVAGARDDVLAHRVGQPLGHEPHRVVIDPADRAIAVQRQLPALPQHLLNRIHQLLHQRNAARRLEPCATARSQVAFGRLLVRLGDDFGDHALLRLAPQKLTQLLQHLGTPPQKTQRPGGHQTLHQHHPQLPVRAVVALGLRCEPDRVLLGPAFVERAGHRQPPRALAGPRLPHLDAQIRQRFADVVQQRADEDRIGPVVALRVDDLGATVARQKVAAAQHQRVVHRLERVGEQPADVGMVVRLRGRHQLHELGVALDRRQQIPLEHRLGQA